MMPYFKSRYNRRDLVVSKLIKSRTATWIPPSQSPLTDFMKIVRSVSAKASVLFRCDVWSGLWTSSTQKLPSQHDKTDENNNDIIVSDVDIVKDLIPSGIKEIVPNSWETMDEICKGDFTSEVKIKLQDKIMAVKHMQMSDDVDPADIYSELTILRDITRDGCDFFIHLFGVSTDLYTVSIFTDCVIPRLSLADVIYKEQYQVDYVEKINIAIQLCQAVDYLHTKLSIVHNDINPENIMIRNGKPVLCDFGCAGYIGSTHNICCGTMQYMAPEAVIIQCQSLAPSLDVWSLAATVIELFIAMPPWPEVDDDDEFEEAFPVAMKLGFDICPEGLDVIGNDTLFNILRPCFYAPQLRPHAGDLIAKFEMFVPEYENEID